MKTRILSFTILFLILNACSGPKKENKTEALSWASAMQGTAKSFQELLPYLYSQEDFMAKKNTSVILAKISDFKNSIHKIDDKQAKQILGDDPYVLKGIESLKELTERAEISFSRGDKKNSQILLKATTNTCFKCHTRQNLGPESITWNQFDIQKIKTSSIEKTHLLISMRQFDKAKEVLKSFLTKSEDTEVFDIEYETAVHYYIMISLRAQGDLESTLKFIQSKILISKSPIELHYTLKYWASDLSYWIKNKKMLKDGIASAKTVLKRNLRQYSDRNLINNLVASQILHQTLQVQKNGNEKAQSYQLLGQIYDELVVEGYWDLPEIYFEMCVRLAPKTPIAQKCFMNFKNNITIGYSGSRGTLIPAEEYKRIEELRKISGVK